MSYHLRYSEDSRRDVRRLPGHLRHRARRTMEALADNPRPPGFRELRDHPGYFRLRLDEVILMKDKSGQVIGFEKLNFAVATPDSLRVAFEPYDDSWHGVRISGQAND